MQSVFLELVKLSLIGSLFAAAVMLVRLVFRKAPKWLFCILWGVVALRLICPVSIESNVSLVPDRLATGQIITNVGNEYIGDVDIIYESNAGYSNAIEAGRQPIRSNDGNYVVTEKDSLEAPKTVAETVYPILSWVWVAGMVLMLVYTAVSYLLLRKKMEEATQLRENVWQCEQVDSPFVLGFIKPRIYLPYAITDSDMANVIAHEQAHIQRKDHWWKPIGFLLLSIHWFNPVLWLAYILLCRDIEAACDEKVIKHMEKDEIRAYSTALLHCSVHRRRIAACPLAFGETGVKERIKRVMNYKKPAFWIILLALVASIAVCVLLLTNPVAKNTTLMGANYKVTEVLYSTADEDDDRYSRFMITADYVLYAQLEGDESWCIHKKMEAYPLTAKELQKYTANKTGWKENYRIKEITDAYIYRAENDWFYLAAQTKNGDTLIGIGWEDVSERGQGASDDTYLRYVYKVESEFSENEFNVNFFVHSLYEALGVTDCFEAYTNEGNPGFMVVGFMSDYNDKAEYDYNDMGFAVFQSQNNGYRLLDYHVYEDAANQNEGILFCDHPAVMSLDGSMDHNGTFDVIISCNTNLDKIQREYYKDDKLSKQIASTHLSGGKSMTLFRWDEMVGSNLRIKQYYLDSEGNEIAFEKYAEAVNNDNLIAMVYDIAHNPDCASSSNPFDYIEAKRALYNEIISYGSSAVDCFVERLRSGENGLQGYIMAVACADITGIGDKDLGADWVTAQEWLALYDNNASLQNHLDYDKLSSAFSELCKVDLTSVYLHGANVLFDEQGMPYELLLMVSAVSDNKVTSGNLLFKWRKDNPVYDISVLNPDFIEVEEGYGSVDSLMTLSSFLSELRNIEASSVIQHTLPATDKPFRLNYGIGIPEELPIANNASSVFVDLSTGAVNVIEHPDKTKEYFSIVSKKDDAIIGTLYILVSSFVNGGKEMLDSPVNQDVYIAKNDVQQTATIHSIVVKAATVTFRYTYDADAVQEPGEFEDVKVVLTDGTVINVLDPYGVPGDNGEFVSTYAATKAIPTENIDYIQIGEVIVAIPHQIIHQGNPMIPAP